jgi:hypothetical protein
MPFISRKPRDTVSQPEQSPSSLSETLSTLRPIRPPASPSSDSRAVGRALLTLDRSGRLLPGDLGVEP